MKKIFVFIVIVFFLFSGCGDAKQMNDSNEEFELKRGLNVSHWLSQSSKRGEERANYMKEEDFKLISKLGFDHVRLPIDEEHMWNEAGDKEEDAFKLMHQAIEWSFENNLRVVVDLHVLRSHHFNRPDDRQLWDDRSAQEDFIKFWRELSAELRKYPNSKLAYEPLNEAVAEDPEDWNNLINWVIAEIRKLEPDRTIVMGPNRWQTVGNFKYLRIPENDKNIILSFHYYEPFIITHYQASWSALKDVDVPVHYPGPHIKDEDYKKMDPELAEIVKGYNQNFDYAAIENEIKEAVEFADKNGLKLYCGEFGCYPSTDIEIRKRLYKDWISIFDKYDIAWSHWNYKNDFPVVDEDLEPITELLNILVPR